MVSQKSWKLEVFQKVYISSFTMDITYLFQAGYKYLFYTEELHTWEDAIAECRLFGGWLLDVTDIAEHNCLMRYGNSQGWDIWFWTDGKFKLKTKSQLDAINVLTD